MKQPQTATATAQRRYDRQAVIYDLSELPVEFFAFKKLRLRMWRAVRHQQSILEIGVGTGKNIPYYPQGARVIALDLSPRMLSRAVERARRLGRAVDFVLGDAQDMPFRDGAFDAAAATFVFCSVPDPGAGLREARRVVRNEGGIHLLEHVRSPNPVLGRLMDLLNPPTVRLIGANINRNTVANVENAGIALGTVESRMLGIVKLIRGSRRDASPRVPVKRGVRAFD